MLSESQRVCVNQRGMQLRIHPISLPSFLRLKKTLQGNFGSPTVFEKTCCLAHIFILFRRHLVNVPLEHWSSTMTSSWNEYVSLRFTLKLVGYECRERVKCLHRERNSTTKHREHHAPCLRFDSKQLSERTCCLQQQLYETVWRLSNKCFFAPCAKEYTHIVALTFSRVTW